MLHYMMLYMNQNKKYIESQESAYYGMEIIFFAGNGEL